jgi:TolB-like protein/Tfp pilus assembly protein PilF
MKRCPECRRDYHDDTLLYCLDDGNALLEGPASVDELKTAILPNDVASESVTRAQIQTTDRTAVLPSRVADVPERKSFDKRLLLAPLALAIIVLGGFFGYRYITPAKQIESIAVMPFVNESGNADVEYLSDGMTETLIKNLSNLPNLNVKPRSTVFRYKGKDTDSETIAKELNVEAVLNGRVSQRGDQLTLSLELVDAQKDSVMWSEQYSRKQSDLVTLQSDIARDVSGKLKSKLSGADVAKVERSYTTNTEAYQLYLKGRYQWNKRTTESLRQAAELLKQAIEKDPNYALAYSGLAETFAIFPQYSVAMPNDAMPQAKAMALRALGIDDSLAEAHAALGEYLNYFEYDQIGAEKELRRAIELNPNYATAHQWLGHDVLAPIKRFDEALAEARRAEELDPLSQIVGLAPAHILFMARRYDEAIDQYKRTLSLDPNFSFARYNLGWAFYSKGMYGAAISEYRKALESGYDPLINGYLALALAKSGQRDEAIKLLNQLKLESAERYVPSYAIAIIYIGLNQKDEAFAWLEKDVAEHSAFAVYYAVAPELDELRSEPRFKAMLKQLNLPE